MSYSSRPGPSPSAQGPGGPYPSPYSSYPPQVQVDDGSSGADQIVFVIVSVLAGLVIAVVAAAAWVHVADPASALVTKRGVFLTGELDYDRQVTVTLWFLLIGGAFGFVSGLVVAWLGRRHGVATVLAVIFLCLAASWFSAWLGGEVFGPDLKAQVADASFGDYVSSELSVTSDVAYLGWPIGGLIGALLGIALWPRQDKRPQTLPWSGTVVPHTRL